VCPTRLRIDKPNDDGPKLIRSVPAPVQGLGRAHSLAHVLEISLAIAGMNLGYDDLMGLSGVAFRTPPWPDPPGLSQEETLAALEALNEAFDPALTVHGAEHALTPEEALQAASVSVDAGVPCLALGWGSVKDCWSIIAGYDRPKKRLLGHCVLEAARDAYESWPPQVTFLVTIPPGVKITGAPGFLGAVETAHQRWTSEGRARYRRWTGALKQPNRVTDSTQEAAVELLADARAAANAFVSRLAETVEGNRGAWLARAAEIYHGLLECLEARATPPRSGAAHAGLENTEWRATWAKQLAEVAERDEGAATALRRSPWAELPPEEMMEP